MRIAKRRIESVLGRAAKPGSVWQRQFDHFDAKLREIARYDWDQIPEQHLREYFLDLEHVELQGDLFRHAFPACLKYWYDTLLRDAPAAIGDSDFHRALINGDILSKMLSDQDRQRLFTFFADGFLDRLDRERGFKFVRPGRSAQAWISRFNSLGLVAPVIRDAWTQWWAFNSPGQAVCAVMYATGLVYLKGENPIYLPWTPNEGGGGPYLTEWDASYYERGWLEDNLRFMRETLSVDYVLERLHAAAQMLHAEPESDIAESDLAHRVAADAQWRSEVVAIRIDDLISNLARPALGRERWE
jgi:hypothetical protein